MPHKLWAVGEEVLAADFQSFLQDQVVPQFPNTAARDTWGTPPDGALCVTVDTGTIWRRAAGVWVTATEGARGCVARGTTADGTDFATGTPVQVNATFPALAGRSYLLTAFTTAWADGSAATSNWAVAVNAVVQTNLRWTHIQALVPTDSIQIAIPYHAAANLPACPFTVTGSRVSGTATIRPGVWVWAVYDEGPTPAAT